MVTGLAIDDRRLRLTIEVSEAQNTSREARKTKSDMIDTRRSPPILNQLRRPREIFGLTIQGSGDNVCKNKQKGKR